MQLSGLLREHVERFNAEVRTGDWSSMLEGFEDAAEMEFRGAPVGPFDGKDEIEAAYREQPPDDELRGHDAVDAGRRADQEARHHL